MKNWLRTRLNNSRLLLVIVHDILASAVAWLVSWFLLHDFALPADRLAVAATTLLWTVPLQALLFRHFGLYRGIWRFASLPDLQRLLKAVGAAAILTPLGPLLWGVSVPVSIYFLDPLLLIVGMGGSRFAYRAWKEHRVANALEHPRVRPVIVLGAGSAADFLLRELARNPVGFRVVGLLDDDPRKIGLRIQDVPVLGRLNEIEPWAQRLGVADVILALPSAPAELRQAMTQRCRRAGLNVLTVPSLEDLMHGRVSVTALRHVRLEDLLGREPVRLDDAGLHDWIAGRVVLVSGAGGSIGAELCRQIAHYQPSLLVLLELGEYALYRIEQEFRMLNPNLPIACVIGDVKDAARMREVMQAYKPYVVFHAAAYKHVPLMEKNALQALKNNVLGTYVLAWAACQHGVAKFVMVSTDKAVRPTNVMGASKRLAEMVCQLVAGSCAVDPAVAHIRGGHGTRFVSVRFGNVLGSSGSVIPQFQRQIEMGGPLTVTHPEVTRYFMSLNEAAQLVLQAGLMGRGGEIFVLDMGEPVRIDDLARMMIRLAGKTEAEIGIVYTGLRPGEKLHEELLADEETTLATPHPKLRVARAKRVDLEQVQAMVDWIRDTPVCSDAEVRARLAAWLPEYQPEVGRQVADDAPRAEAALPVPTSVSEVALDCLGRGEPLGDGRRHAGLRAVR